MSLNDVPPKLIVPVAVRFDDPISIAPNPLEIAPAPSVPTDVIFVCDAVFIVPSKFALIVPTLPDTTSEEILASGTNINFPSESSNPKNAVLAEEPL